MTVPPRRDPSLGDLLRELPAGLRSRDLQTLFNRDAANAFRVLTREHAPAAEPTGWLARIRLLFFGITFKLSPARRLLFLFATVAFVLGLLQTLNQARSGIAALWLGLAFAALVFLLALELVDRVVVRDELEVARQLQRELLPRAAPALPSYSFAHSYRTANEIGGDYYDFVPLADGRWALVVGDASGHGMAAGLLMAIAAAVLRLATELDPTPTRVVELVNRALCNTGDRHAFMSLFYAVLDPQTGELEYVCAGHPFPLLRRVDGSSVELGKGGLPLGIHEQLNVVTEKTTIGIGELLVLYTDGIPETVNPSGQAFGFERIAAQTRAETEPRVLHDRLLAALDAHRGNSPMLDDLSLVVMRRGTPTST
jgi:sigma-B regulation protein RsbU (phosphoserine phosphatase)